MQNRRLAVRGIVFMDGALLCVRLKQYAGKATNDGLDYWCTPGGGLDVGEPIVPALERELIEETGIKPNVGNLLYIQQFQHNNWEHVEFFFHVTNPHDFKQIDLAATTHGSIEIAEIEFIDPREHTILPAFLTKEDIGADVASGTAKVFNYL